MKKILLIAPFAVLLANCKTEKNAMRIGANSSMGTSTSTAATTGVSSTGAATNNVYMSTVYDPKNYMQNPERYKTPKELGRAGGWTYNLDWRVNTNFTAEAVGQWQLVPTPDVASLWLRDTSKPESYAAYWTPEAVQARYQAQLIADSVMRLTMNGTGEAGSTGATATTTTSATATTSAGVNTTTGATATGTAAVTNTDGSGSIANSAAGMSSASAASSNPDSYLTAVNGNKFMVPKMNLYIENGSFTGYTGCNNIMGAIKVDGNQIHYSDMMPATNIQCNGGFDQSAFMDRLRRADNYAVVNNQLLLKQGDQVLLVFSKATM